MFTKSKMNEAVFNDSSMEAHYWAGLIAADGCLSVKKGKYKNYPLVIIYLVGEDGKHIQRLLDFLESDKKLFKQKVYSNWAKPNQVNIGTAFWSEHVWNWLHGHGITERKSMTLKTSDLMANSPDFWRGIIDGDGTVNFARNRGIDYPHIGLGGSEDLVKQFQVFINKHLGILPKIGTCRSIYRIAINGQPAQDLIRLLYNRPGPALPRKASAAKACLEWKGKHVNRQRKTLLTPAYAASANSTARSSA